MFESMKTTALPIKAPEIPGSLVSEPKHRDSRFKSRLKIGFGIEIQAWKSLRIGLGTETQTFQVSELEPESKVRESKSRNRNRNRSLVSVEFSL